MTLLQSLSLLLTFAFVVSYINHRWLKLPPAIGVTACSVALTALFLLFGKGFNNSLLDFVEPEIKKFDFHGFLLHGILAFMLFAGATKVNIISLKKHTGPIISLATFGVFISAFFTAVILWGAAYLMQFDLPFIWAFLFGALISPTDPIAALGIVKAINAPKHLETKIVGESLFNDGTGVVLFLTILAIIQGQDQTFFSVSIMLLRELIGAVILGLLLGGILYLVLKTIDDYPVVILSTLAVASGSYALAEAIHVSAPICTVVCGLFIGNKMRGKLSDKTTEHLDVFWDFVDEMLNACLFALMGLELIILDLNWSFIALGFIAFFSTLLGRFMGVAIPLLPFRRKILKGTVPVLTWGGLRGGISLALALSLPTSQLSQLLATLAFVSVILSSLLQGLTLKHIVLYYQKPKKTG